MPVTDPLVIPQLGPLYAAAGPVTEAVLRAAVGLPLVPHGLRLFYGFFPNTGFSVGSFTAFAAILHRNGYRPAWFCAGLVFITEFVGGPLLALGLFTRPAAFAVSVLMGLSVVEHIKDGYFWNKEGIEYPLLWTAGALYFLANGGGLVSLDRLWLGFAF